MATNKKAAKKIAVKPAQASGGKSVNNAKKVVPVKKQASKKVVTKSVPKKAVKPVAVKKPIAKPVAKAPAKKIAAVKNALPAKQITAPLKGPKSIEKNVIKKVAPLNPASVKAVKSVIKPMAKKEEIKKPIAKAKIETPVQVKPVAEVKIKDIKVPAPKPVVIPKIATKTVRKYQPDFTKSVLDKTERDPGAPTQRYSDPELSEFKELIQRKLEAAKKELSYLHGLITRKDEMGGDEGDNRYMTMEDGSLSMEREQLSQMASRQITFIDHLEKAIMRIENKTYGICRVTGKLIDKARLRAVPHATLSIEAKMGAVK